MFKGKKWFGQKLWATVIQSIKTVLGWKFWLQDLLHEPEVLSVSLAHLVARKGWAYAKGLKGTDPYPQTTLPPFPPISRMGLGHA